MGGYAGLFVRQISIGSDAVAVAEAWYAAGRKATGASSIEAISAKYGAQAVVVSIDPRRVYVHSPKDVRHACVRAAKRGPAGEEWCWRAQPPTKTRLTRPQDFSE